MAMNRMANEPGMQGEARGKHRTGSAPDENALIDGVAAERMEAFETLYRLYHPRLTRFLRGMTRRPSLVEEILNDTMMVVWRKAHTYQPDARVSTWIFGIAYRQALKALRRQDDIAVSVAPLQDGLADPMQVGPDMEVQRLELHARIDQAMNALSAEQRAVIELTYYLGYSCRDVAQVMDCPVDTVKTRMFYARRKMKTVLGLSREEAI
ncbi:RNA polymerase sigma factor [Lysobacter niastensis]|uniref:RNA polymerase sigma factor n=1 Tax=Lysobacter niastensis TaxID=380629 RepID=A0ABS0BAI5_9GAMM|nr:RNA polymerase sigma factor [Lysobacter niastensis]MBF6024165.1 RNA polymerase sigma factor [Lysobacter niastensis]